MALTIGIVGLPNAGKSTLFNALTRNDVLAANYPFATIEPNVGVVGVPDARLPELAKVFGSERIADYLTRHDWTREDAFNDNFPDPAAHAYERQWQATCPLYMSGVVAMLGGWNFPWPDGDFAECAGDVLVLWTLRGSEPWLEVFVRDSAWRVVERRS